MDGEKGKIGEEIRENGVWCVLERCGLNLVEFGGFM